MKQFKWGDKIRLKTGEFGVFEEYDATNNNKAFVIIDPDTEGDGSQLVKLKDIERL